jgi:two-component system, OmpR family, sensor histidine kinase KdpD
LEEGEVEGARDRGQEAPVVALPGFSDELLELLGHELRPPLNAARWLAEGVRSTAETIDPEHLRQATDSLLRTLRYLGTLLDSMLDEAEGSPGEIRVQRRPVKVDDIVRETVEDMSSLLQERLIAVSVEGRPIGLADPDRLRQAVTALLVNAARYGTGRTPIWVRVVGRPQVVEVAVADHCGGIPAASREWIFRRHTRLDHGGDGRGLGLFLARRLARAQGGDLRVSSAPSWGCRFVITLPRVNSVWPA